MKLQIKLSHKIHKAVKVKMLKSFFHQDFGTETKLLVLEPQENLALPQKSTSTFYNTVVEPSFGSHNFIGVLKFYFHFIATSKSTYALHILLPWTKGQCDA